MAALEETGLFRVEKVGGSFIFSSMGLQKCLTTVFSPKNYGSCLIDTHRLTEYSSFGFH